jgi:hypothetical protein
MGTFGVLVGPTPLASPRIAEYMAYAPFARVVVLQGIHRDERLSASGVPLESTFHAVWKRAGEA